MDFSETPLIRVAELAISNPDFFDALLSDADAALADAGIYMSSEARATLDSALAGKQMAITFSFAEWVHSSHSGRLEVGSGRQPGPRWPGMWADPMRLRFSDERPAPVPIRGKPPLKTTAAKKRRAPSKVKTKARRAPAKARGATRRKHK